MYLVEWSEKTESLNRNIYCMIVTRRK